MAEVFANSKDPDQMPGTPLFANYPFRGLLTTMGYTGWMKMNNVLSLTMLWVNSADDNYDTFLIFPRK